MYAVALRPGSWPPSPGFEPWAILISSWSARARYVAVTPNRAEATCLIEASRRSPSGPGAYQAGSSPPSPVFAAPPASWIPMREGLVCLGASAPTLIAETTNRRTIDGASSTSERSTEAGTGRIRSSSRGTAWSAAGRASADAVARERVIDRGGVGCGVRSAAFDAVGSKHLDLAGDARREEMRLAIAAEPSKSGIGQSRLAAGSGLGDGERGRAAPKLTLGDIGECRPAGPRRSGREAPLDDRGVEVDDVDERATDVRGDRADAHSRQRLAKTGLEGGDEARDGLGGCQRLGTARAGKLRGELDREPRMDCGRADRQDHRHGVDIENVDGADREVRPASEAGRGERGVDGARGEDRRHRQPVDRPRLVGQDEDFCLASGGRDRLGRQPIQRSLEASRPFPGVPRRVQRPDGNPVVVERGDEPGEIRDDRPRQSGRPRATRQAAEECRPTAELHPQVHDHALALGVDGGVRHLRERLAQVVGHRSIHPAAAWRRCVVAHAPQRLVALERHRLDVEARPLGVEPREVAHRVVRRSLSVRAPAATLRPALPTGPRGPAAARHGSAANGGPRPSPRRPRGWRGAPARRGGARRVRGAHAG